MIWDSIRKGRGIGDLYHFYGQYQASLRSEFLAGHLLEADVIATCPKFRAFLRAVREVWAFYSKISAVFKSPPPVMRTEPSGNRVAALRALAELIFPEAVNP